MLELVLNQASTEERSALAEILEAETPTIEGIADAFNWNAQSIFGYLFTDKPSYSQIVKQVAEKLDIKHAGRLPTKALEVRIAQRVLRTIWDKMTSEQRTRMETKLRQVAQEFDKGGALLASGSIFATLTAAKLSGFGVYLLASTSLGALTGAIGVTLPFAAYTTMSSAIATILGPVGWIGAGLFAIWKLSAPNYKRLIPAVLYVSALRAQQERLAQQEQEWRDWWIGLGFIIIIGVILILAVYFFVFN